MSKDKCTDKGYCTEVYREFNKLHDYYIGEINKLKAENKELKKKIESLSCSDDCYRLQPYKHCLNEIKEICSNNLSVKLLFKDRMDLAIFIRRRIEEVKGNG